MNKLSLAERREKMRIVLNQARSELNQTGRSYLLGQFTYADIAMASALQMIEPVSDFYSRRGLAMRAAWTDKVLEAEFADLLEWRNQIYARNRIRQRLNEGRSTE